MVDNNKNYNNENVSFDELSLRSPLAVAAVAAAAVDFDISIPISFLFRMYTACQILQLSTETRYTAIVLLQRYAGMLKQTAVSSLQQC